MTRTEFIYSPLRIVGLHLCGLVLMLFTTPAQAWDWLDSDHATWPGGVYEYRVNKNSFPASLQGNNMSADQYLWWINYGFSQWKERTGSLVYGHYLGTTTATPNTTDGINAISAKTGCSAYSPGCTILARAHLVSDFYDDFIEGDVTFFGAM